MEGLYIEIPGVGVVSLLYLEMNTVDVKNDITAVFSVEKIAPGLDPGPDNQVLAFGVRFSVGEMPVALLIVETACEDGKGTAPVFVPVPLTIEWASEILTSLEDFVKFIWICFDPKDPGS